MKNNRWMLVMVLLATVSLAISACSIAVDRNPDGSLRLEVDLPESTIQEEIAAALNDPLITDLQTDLRQGYIFVTAERKRVLGEETDMLSFRLDLGAQNGHLTAVISDAKINDEPVNEAYVEVWNQRLAQRLEEAAKRNPDSSLQSVSVGDDALNFIWRIETARSRGE
ncbi:MAG: hypothetical protein ACFE9C_06960 [Candidatus Hodarchaeota archaeon]